ncbi:MAG: hypothetical protein KC416_04290 [Myxococcales bacterium]|nr:hypothetical protein [Myxococcales bacterium]
MAQTLHSGGSMATKLPILLGFTLPLLACAADGIGTGEPSKSPNGGKTDSGWLGSDSYELGAVARGQVRMEPVGSWSTLESSAELQLNLIDEQLRFAKNGSEAQGYRLNLLSDQVRVLEVDYDGGDVILDYEVVVDLVAPIRDSVPELADIANPIVDVTVPARPVGIHDRVGTACATKADASPLNYAYYFDADQPGCDIERATVEIEITHVFGRPTTYPEYDLLMKPTDRGTLGFRAALVPARGDYDPASRFDAHRLMLENDLNLVGQPIPGQGRRYIFAKGNVEIEIDLYDPTQVQYSESFRNALGEYDFILYNGHSNYGKMHLLDEPESFSDHYQIIMMHSCQSYAYYTRQVFRAKETADDPHGWDRADVVATGKSSYPKGSPKTAEVILQGLLDGMDAIDAGRSREATDWLSMIESMNRVERGILYGAAGVRENRWQPID